MRTIANIAEDLTRAANELNRVVGVLSPGVERVELRTAAVEASNAAERIKEVTVAYPSRTIPRSSPKRSGREEK